MTAWKFLDAEGVTLFWKWTMHQCMRLKEEFLVNGLVDLCLLIGSMSSVPNMSAPSRAGSHQTWRAMILSFIGVSQSTSESTANV